MKSGMKHFRYAMAGLLWALAAGWAGAQTAPVASGPGVKIVADLVALYAPGRVHDSLSSEVRRPAVAGGVKEDAIFEHPLNPGVEASIDYELVLPPVHTNETLTFAFDLALSDGIDLKQCDGVRFLVCVNGDAVFAQDSQQCAWQSFAVDLGRWARKKIKLSLRTNCRQNTAYDWALWGNPRVLLAAGQPLPSLATGTGGAVPFIAGVAVVSPLPVALQRFRIRSEGGTTVEWAKPADTSGYAAAELLVKDFSFAAGKSVTVDWEPRAALSAGDIRLAAYPADLRLTRVSPTRALLLAGEEVPVRVVVRNEGRGSSSAGQAGVTLGLGAQKSPELAVPALRPGEGWGGEWRAPLPAVFGEYDLSAGLRDGVAGKTELRHSLEVYPGRGGTANSVANERVKLEFVSENGAYAYANVFARETNNWRLVAVWRPLFQINSQTRGGPKVWRIHPGSLRVAPGNPHAWELSGTGEDADGVAWEAKLRVDLPDREPNQVRLRYEWRPAADRQIRSLLGPNIYVGEGTSGAAKEWGLFPGLEYLYGAEPSSNLRDFSPPLNDRRTPSPDKITLPLMAVTIGPGIQKLPDGADRFFTPDSSLDIAMAAAVPSSADGFSGFTVGLFWDVNQKWDGKRTLPTAQFSSPNRGEGMDNHRLALLLPSAADGVPENGEAADVPFSIAAGTSLSLEATLVVTPGPVMGVVREYLRDRGGLPAATAWPRSFQAELDLCRTGFLQTAWDPVKMGWRHCAGWVAGPAPGFAALLWMDAQVAEKAEARAQSRERVELVGRRMLEQGGPGLLTSQAACHIMQWEFPFLYGCLPEAISALEPQVRGLIQSQTPAGGWFYQPADQEQASLGRAGDSVLGTCANKAALLLRFARITGDPAALAAGERALKFMEQFRVPRGGQTWECPMYEPDILAAAYAIRAYHDGFRATGNARWLHDAQYWAESGVPFLYGWTVPDHPMMLGATIPVFGSTFYTHSWLAMPVQWCGLVYAYHVLHLAQELEGTVPGQEDSPLPVTLNFQPSDWKRMVELITASALQQQITTGNDTGLYPDSISDFKKRNPAFINPEDILLNVLALQGHDPDIKSQRVGSGASGTVISSGARIRVLAAEKGSLKFALQGFAGETSHILVKIAEPREVLVNGQPLPKSASPVRRESGWSWDAANQRAFINAPHSQEQVVIEIHH